MVLIPGQIILIYEYTNNLKILLWSNFLKFNLISLQK